jgi:hypothetical protein
MISMMTDGADQMITILPIKIVVTMNIIDLIDIMMRIAIMTEEEDHTLRQDEEDQLDLSSEVQRKKEQLLLVFMLEIYPMTLVKKMYLNWLRDMAN